MKRCWALKARIDDAPSKVSAKCEKIGLLETEVNRLNNTAYVDHLSPNTVAKIIGNKITNCISRDEEIKYVCVEA